jgi:hypothetical protein
MQTNAAKVAFLGGFQGRRNLPVRHGGDGLGTGVVMERTVKELATALGCEPDEARGLINFLVLKGVLVVAGYRKVDGVKGKPSTTYSPAPDGWAKLPGVLGPLFVPMS